MKDAIPSHLKYTKDHEWALIDGDTAIFGITDHAQHQLGDVVYLELPETGKKLQKGKLFGVVESVKAVSDLFSPLSGEVTEVNRDLVNQPEALNQDPYGKAWMIKVRVSSPEEMSELMDNSGYNQYLKEHAK